MKEENKYFEVLNSFIDSIAILNRVGEIVFTNISWKNFSINNSGDPKKTGLGVNYLNTCKDVLGNEIENALEAQAGIKKVINREIPFFELEYACHSVDQKRWFMLRATPLEIDPELTLISHINITKQKLIENEVLETNTQMQLINERLNSTIYKIAHDIQSPLNSIEGLVNLTKLENKIADINIYFGLITKSIINLKSYIKDTLRISTFDLIYEPLDFKLMIYDFIRSIQHNEALMLVRIEINIEQESDFCSDKNEINSIFSNLISNCLKYFDIEKKEPFAIISVHSNKKEAVISIKDNGIGIQKKDIGKIFEMNFQADKNSAIGTGIGLHMVKKSIDKLNGTIKVISEYGKGTEFILTIPNHMNDKTS